MRIFDICGRTPAYASLAGPISAIAVATLGLATLSPVHAASVVFDFNSPSLGQGASNSSIQSYMNGILTQGTVTLPNTTSGCTNSNPAGSGNPWPNPTGSSNTPCPGAVAEQTYTGEGHVIGIVGSPSDPLYSSSTHVTPLTLGNTDGYNGVINYSSGFPIGPAPNDQLDTYITNRQHVTSAIKMVFTPGAGEDPFKITDIAFDFEIFPEANNVPDLTFKFKDQNGVVHQVAYVQGTNPNPGYSPASVAGGGDMEEDSKQAIGHMHILTNDYCATFCYATELVWADWPSAIGIDNLALDVPPPPPRENAPEPMTGALLLSGLGGLWLARRRGRTTA